MENNKQNTNGVMVISLLKEQKTPLTATEVMMIIAKSSGLDPRVVRNSVMNTLEGGVCFGYLQKRQGKYSYVPESIKLPGSSRTSVASRSSTRIGKRTSSRSVVQKSSKASAIGRRSSGRITRRRRSALKAVPRPKKSSVIANSSKISARGSQILKRKTEVPRKSGDTAGFCQNCMCPIGYIRNGGMDNVAEFVFDKPGPPIVTSTVMQDNQTETVNALSDQPPKIAGISSIMPKEPVKGVDQPRFLFTEMASIMKAKNNVVIDQPIFPEIACMGRAEQAVGFDSAIDPTGIPEVCCMMQGEVAENIKQFNMTEKCSHIEQNGQLLDGGVGGTPTNSISDTSSIADANSTQE